MSAIELYVLLRAKNCPVCGRSKRPGHSFCYRCYRALPGKVQKALWRRMGQGYEEAHFGAVAHLYALKSQAV